MQQTLHDRGINIVAPTYTFTDSKNKIPEGDFISIPLHRDTVVSFQEMEHYITRIVSFYRTKHIWL